MLKWNIPLASITILSCVLLIAGALACGLGNDDDTEADEALNRVQRLATENTVQLQVLKAGLDQMEQANQDLADRVAGLEKEKQDLTHRLAVLEEFAAVAAASVASNPALASPPAAAQPSGLGAAYDAASEEDRAVIREFLECSMRAGGVPENEIPQRIPESEKVTWHVIDEGTETLDNFRMLRDIVCPPK
ncbi:MAG: hypothetical protein F4X64_16280 [Chloroflexi bacterium]|nr:hypothetical protein [Chloroflexota bacterium]